MVTSPPILVLDSGIGGFSVLRELLKIAPGQNYLYLADQAYFPYGDKDPKWVRSRIVELVKFGEAAGVKAVVVACNTGTVHGIKELRKQFDIPIFGVEPVIKPLASYQNAAILATSSTAKSEKTLSLQAQNNGYHIKVVGAPGLASAVEDMDQAATIDILTHLNSQLQGVEALGLSCTHYPLAMSAITQVFPGVKIIDPGEAVARHVAGTLSLSPSPTTDSPRPRFITTGSVLRLREQLSYYLGISAVPEQQKI